MGHLRAIRRSGARRADDCGPGGTQALPYICGNGVRAVEPVPRRRHDQQVRAQFFWGGRTERARSNPGEARLGFDGRRGGLLHEAAKNVLERAVQEGHSLGYRELGTGHILLGLLQENQSGALQILHVLGAEPSEIRRATLKALGTTVPSIEEQPPSPAGQQPSRPRPPMPNEPVEAVPTHRDRPAVHDELGRARLAAVLGERIRRARGEDTEPRMDDRRSRRHKLAADRTAARSTGNFMVHVYAPWGARQSPCSTSWPSTCATGSPVQREPRAGRARSSLVAAPRGAAMARCHQSEPLAVDRGRVQRLGAPAPRGPLVVAGSLLCNAPAGASFGISTAVAGFGSGFGISPGGCGTPGPLWSQRCC